MRMNKEQRRGAITCVANEQRIEKKNSSFRKME
jgi:hypothetical protein